MKKIKELWNSNRVLFVLIVILIACFTAILVVALTFFYSKNVSNYGTRLDDIDKYPITDKIKSNYKETLLENEHISKVTINVIGRIIYIHLIFDENQLLEDAKTIAINSLDLFEEDILGYYDINFDLKSDNFVIFGAKNAITEQVSWNNNREVITDDEEE